MTIRAARQMPLPLLFLSALVLSNSLPVASAARDKKLCPPDPYLNPKQDICNPLRYIASNTLTSISFSLILVVGLIQTFYVFRWGAKYMLAMVIGCYTFALGLGLRYGLHADPQNSSTYIVYYLFVVLSPCAFIAADYILLGRLTLHLGMQKHLLVPAHRLTIIFITSDITTFLIQAAGGGMSAGANTLQVANIATKIFLAGLAMQLISFVVFTFIYAFWLYRVFTQEKAVWHKDAHRSWLHDWRTLAGGLVLSCIGILIRSAFRTVELSEGYNGYLSTKEAYFYSLDTLPLFVAVVVYVAVWPGRFIPNDLKHVKPQTDVEGEERGEDLEDGVEMDESARVSQITATADFGVDSTHQHPKVAK